MTKSHLRLKDTTQRSNSPLKNRYTYNTVYEIRLVIFYSDKVNQIDIYP